MLNQWILLFVSYFVNFQSFTPTLSVLWGHHNLSYMLCLRRMIMYFMMLPFRIVLGDRWSQHDAVLVGQHILLSEVSECAHDPFCSLNCCNLFGVLFSLFFGVNSPFFMLVALVAVMLLDPENPNLCSGSFLNSFPVNFDHAYQEILCTHCVIIMSSRSRWKIVVFAALTEMRLKNS